LIMDNKIQVLLAEDDAQLGMLIKENLEDEGYEVRFCENGATAWDQFQKEQPDICLLDVNMPERDGFSLAKKIRQKSDVVPIIFLTAKSMEEDKLKGFETGADDYVTKPFSFRELVSRIQVFIRRNKMLMKENKQTYQWGNLFFNPSELLIRVEGTDTTLTQKEADLLNFFCEHADKALKREDILTHIWGKNDYFLGRSMDVFITRLRKYFKADPSIILETIHGIGFRLNLPVQ
jgi:DNA-binding response OmpR family regulator